MDLELHLDQLPPTAQKIVRGEVPPKVREMAANGVILGAKSSDVLKVLVALSTESDDIATAASHTLKNLKPAILNSALDEDLAPGVIDRLIPIYHAHIDVVEKLLRMPSIDPTTVEKLARTSSERVSELIATNEARLLNHPKIIEALYLNKYTRMSTADRILELAVRNEIELDGIGAFKEAAAAIKEELIPEASDEPTYDDLVFQETEEIAAALSVAENEDDADPILVNEEGEEAVKQKFTPLTVKLATLSITKKIRRALMGTAAERTILVRDSNRLVATAAIRSPMIQENEVARMSSSRNINDEVLRIIATKGEWLKSHTIKYNLVCNPRTPFVHVVKLIPHLRDAELRALSRNRNVSGSVQTIAKRILQRKGK
jgi:hypothetical protein